MTKLDKLIQEELDKSYASDPHYPLDNAYELSCFAENIAKKYAIMVLRDSQLQQELLKE